MFLYMFIGGILGQCLAHRVRSEAVPLPRIDMLAVRSAYGGGLHIDEQFVKFFYRYIKYSPCRAEAHKGYKIHHLVAGQHTRALQNSESSVYLSCIATSAHIRSAAARSWVTSWRVIDWRFSIAACSVMPRVI